MASVFERRVLPHLKGIKSLELVIRESPGHTDKQRPILFADEINGEIVFSEDGTYRIPEDGKVELTIEYYNAEKNRLFRKEFLGRVEGAFFIQERTIYEPHTIRLIQHQLYLRLSKLSEVVPSLYVDWNCVPWKKLTKKDIKILRDEEISHCERLNVIGAISQRSISKNYDIPF